MHIQVINHPLVSHKLTVLRNKDTSSAIFRLLTEELVTLLAYEATRNIATQTVSVQTPITETVGVELSKPTPLVVPILRAGLGMLEGMTKLLPTAEVGFLGMLRDDKTLQVTSYAQRLPEDLTGRQIYVLDPMLATGATLKETINFLLKRNAKNITVICLLAVPEGLKVLENEFANEDITIVMGALDEKLNSKSYIVPGLGDAGDRLYGVV